MTRFSRFSLAAAVAAMALAPVAGCSKSANPAQPSAAVPSDALDKGKPAQGYQLNLSHIECVEDGTIEVHFVLLFVPDGVTPPASLAFTFDGGGGNATRQDPKTGNVWHYAAYLNSPLTIENLNASLTVGGTLVSLHNPGAYSGTYDCSPEDVCETAPPPDALVCLARPLGSEDNECAYFAPEGYTSVALGKDQALEGETLEVPYAATMNAAFAIVKTGAGQTGCDPGEHAYRVVPGVSVGDLLASPGTGDAISHVTYCSCPTPIVQ